MTVNGPWSVDINGVVCVNSPWSVDINGVV